METNTETQEKVMFCLKMSYATSPAAYGIVSRVEMFL